MGYALIASASAGSSDQQNVTTPPINTTGATFIGLSITKFQPGIAGFTLTDSKSNTPIILTPQDNSNSANVLYYYNIPIVGSGHTWTLNSTSGAIFPTLSVVAFSGSAASPFEAETGSFSNAVLNSIQPGPLTPAEDGCLIITGATLFVGTGITIDSGFSRASTDYAGNNLGGGIGWLIQGAKAAVNPTWMTGINVNGADATMAVFKPVPAVTGGLKGSLMTMGCGN